MKRLVLISFAALLSSSMMAKNLVPENKREFEVPFKGEGKMGMVYQPVFFPSNTKGAVISFEVKYENVVRGAQSWFDARVMSNFIDSQCGKVAAGPNIGGWHGSSDWKAVKKTVKVPDGAAGIALMPTLFNVKSGSMWIRNLSVEAQETFVEDPADKAKREAYEKKKIEMSARRRAKAKERLETAGSIIPPPRGEHFADLVSKAPGKMTNGYGEYDLPEGVEALTLSWKWKISNLKKGEKPWFDARMLVKFKDASGKEVKPEPSPVYTGKNTDGFVEKSTSFLVPKEAAMIVLMPCLFQVKSGEMIVDDVKLVTTDPEPLVAAKKERERQALARKVPDEPEKREKWPKMLRVQGNRLVDPDGKEVWLQGVNAGGLETVPHSEQVEKSTVVAIDEWKANCIRLPINEAHWFGTGVYQNNDGGVAFRRSIDKIVRLAANRGAYVAIDLHRFRAPRQEHIDFWKSCAAHYKDHPAVIFDLFNEPHGISWEVWRNGGFVGEQGKRDESAFLSAEDKKKNQGFESVGMQALVDAVRSTGAKNVVIAGGLFWANDLTGIESEAIEKGEKPSWRLEDKDGNGIMYSWHTYHWHKGWKRILPVAAKHPIFLGEVGASPLGVMNFIPDHEQENPYTFSPAMLGFIQKLRINWTGWCFHPKAAPCMLENWDYKPTPYWGEFAKRALAGEKFEMDRMR